MGDILRFARDVLRGIGLALGMHPDTVQFVERHPETGWIIMVIAVLAGASTLLGQSVVLFLNRVQPTRFVVSLFLNGVILALSFLDWGVAIWLLGTSLLDSAPTLGLTLRMVGLSTAPFVFGFLALIPYLGDVIARVLYVWSLLIMVRAVDYTFGVPFVTAAVLVGAGWLLLLVVNNTIGRPVVALRNRVWSRVLGTQHYASAHDLLTAYAAPGADQDTRGKP